MQIDQVFGNKGTYSLNLLWRS